MFNGCKCIAGTKIAFNVFLCIVPVRVVGLNVSDGDHVTVGDVIQCSANTFYPPVSYYWQQYVNESWQQLQQQDDDSDDDDDDGRGSMLRLSTAGVYVLRCVGYNVIKTFTYNATSDSVTLYVDEPGKY